MIKSRLVKNDFQNIPVFNRKDWVSAYCNVEKELTDIQLNPKTGSIPKELYGTLYRNGPGRLERGGQWVHHPFDGDGMIASINFEKGQAKLSNRFIRTKGWIEEESAGKFLYRGVFGTQKSGGLLRNAFDVRLKNIANTNVIKLGNELLALWEAGEPYLLDPKTLQTKGISNLNGALSPGEALSAHPRFDPGHHGKPRMIIFGVKTGPKSNIRLMEFESEGDNPGNLISDRKDSFGGFAFLHDFAITPNWAIFLQNAISFNPLPFIFGQKGAAQCLSSQKNKKGKIWLIPRKSGKFTGQPPRIINGTEGFVFHHLNAFESNNNLILDSIHYEDFPSINPGEDFREINFDLVPEGLLKRCKIDLSKNTLTIKNISNQCCEFAMVNPHYQGLKAQYSWMAIAQRKCGNGPLQAIKKIDLINQTEIIWSSGPRGFVSEPIFIPKPSLKKEDEGWVLCLIWNAEIKKTELIILDAEDMTLKCVLDIPIGIPHGLHGSWANKN